VSSKSTSLWKPSVLRRKHTGKRVSVSSLRRHDKVLCIDADPSPDLSRVLRPMTVDRVSRSDADVMLIWVDGATKPARFDRSAYAWKVVA
jgi:hypothetical protein